MQKKLLQKSFLIFLALCGISSCASKKDPYILSHLQNIQNYEKQDHQFCTSLNLDFNKVDNEKSRLYWRCRLSFAKYKIRTDTSISANVKYNLEISDLIAKISLKIAETPEAVLLQEGRKMDNRQHKQCLAMGFNSDTLDQIKVDDYFACRKFLIAEQQLLPPYGNKEYLKYPNRSYNIGFVIDNKIDQEIKRYNEAKEKYPTCMKYYLEKENFKGCTLAQDNSKQCFSEVDLKKFRKESEEKVICQKKAYIQYPNSFLKENEQEAEDIARNKANSDFLNKNDLTSLQIKGILTFDADLIRAKKERDKKKVKKDINSKDGLYRKYELTQLRQKYVLECQKESDVGLMVFVSDLREKCKDLANFTPISE